MTQAESKQLFIEGIKDLLEETPDLELVHLIYTILWKSKAQREGAEKE